MSPYLDRERSVVDAALNGDNEDDGGPPVYQSKAPIWSRGYNAYGTGGDQGFVDPNDPRVAGGVTQDPSKPTGSAPGQKTLQELQAEWDAEYAELLANGTIGRGGGMNRQRPGSEGRTDDPAGSAPESGYGPGGTSNPAYTSGPKLPGDSAPAGTGPASDRSRWAAAAKAAAAGGYTDIDLGGTRLTTGDYRHQLAGMGDLDALERGSETMKRQFARIASRYDVSQPGAARNLVNDPDFKALFPNAKIVEHENEDLIDFGLGGDPVDVIEAATKGGAGKAWQWLPKSATGGGSSGYGGNAGKTAVNTALGGGGSTADSLARDVATTVGLPTGGGLTAELLAKLLDERSTRYY